MRGRRGAVFLSLVLGATAALAPIAAVAQAAAQVIAILEEIEPSPDDAAARDRPLVPQLRAAFVRQDTGWSPVCATASAEDEAPQCLDGDFAREQRWSLVRNGRPAGEARSGGWYDRKRMRTVGSLRLVSPVAAAERSAAFAGADGEPVRRPVIALTRLREGVPGGWREAPVRREDIEGAVRIFAAVMPKVPGCTPDTPGDAPLSAEHFRPIGGLASDAGERVFGVRVDPARRKDCPGAPGVEWSDFWLHTDGKAAPQLLSFGPMTEAAMRSTLVDIGDWDGDGKVDAVFWHATPGEDGYVLVWGGFDNLVRAMRTYH